MIGKVVQPGKGFRGLINYLLKGPKPDPNDPAAMKAHEDRVAWIEMNNMLIDDPEKAPALMRATAMKSKRVQRPVYHFVISWHKNEAPTQDMMRQVAHTTLDDIDLADYQSIMIAHHDKEHRHVHIIVNRVHPETGVAWRTSNDYQRIEISLRKQSESLGLEIVPGRHLDPELSKDKPRRTKTPELRKAKREDKTPRPQWSKELIAERRDVIRFLIDTVTSWDELHHALKPLGLTLERKGQGIVFADHHGDMKLSALGKTYRLADLEARYNEAFAAPLDEPNATQERRHSPEPAPETSKPATADRRTPVRQLQRRKARPYKTFDRKPEPKADTLWAELANARAQTDYALILYRMGLSSSKALRRAFAEQDRAQQAVDATKPIMQQLMKPTPEEKPKPQQKQPTKQQSKKRRHNLRRRHDMDR